MDLKRILPLKPSMRAFLNEASRDKNMSFFDIIHGYFYIRFIYFYIAMGTGRHSLAKRLAPLVDFIGKLIVSNVDKNGGQQNVHFADTYHGKVVTPDAARQLVSVKQNISLGDLEKIIPYARARQIILENPQHIVVLDCACRAASKNPCYPLDVCLVIGEPFASLVVEHHPRRSRRISSEEAQSILQAEHKRGHVHHAFFKDAMLGRFYAICNCCSCCCAAVQAQRNGTPMLASSGYVAYIAQDVCQGCRKCEQMCPFSAIQNRDGRAYVDVSVCMGCGVCENACKFKAISLQPLEARGIPLEIDKLIDSYQERQSVE